MAYSNNHHHDDPITAIILLLIVIMIVVGLAGLVSYQPVPVAPTSITMVVPTPQQPNPSPVSR